MNLHHYLKDKDIFNDTIIKLYFIFISNISKEDNTLKKIYFIKSVAYLIMAVQRTKQNAVPLMKDYFNRMYQRIYSENFATFISLELYNLNIQKYTSQQN